MNTNTYNRILCATDFSDPSYEGLSAAADMARKLNATLTVIHVITPMPLLPSTPAFAPTGIELKHYLDNVEASAREELSRLSSRYSSPGLEISTTVRTGDPAEEIVDFAAANRCDMIVLSTHGHSGWKRLMTGSVAEKVVRSANRAVLTIHRTDDEHKGDSANQEQESAPGLVEARGVPMADLS